MVSRVISILGGASIRRPVSVYEFRRVEKWRVERQDFTRSDNNVAAVPILQPSSLCVCKLLKRSCKARKSPKGGEEEEKGKGRVASH